MKIRPYVSDRDFGAIESWMGDERAHAMWCANRFPYPLRRESFEAALEEFRHRFGDRPYVAAADDGETLGLFCFSVDQETRVGRLKLVIVSPRCRNKGYGRQMIALAVQHGFETAKADAIRLNVFSENLAARRCYERAGFTLLTEAKEAFAFGDEKWGRCTMTIQRRDRESGAL